MVIRDSRPEDLERMHAIYAHHVLHGLASFEEEPPSVEELARRRGDVVGRGLPHVVAEHEGTIIGFSYASLYRPRSAYRYTLEDSVYVAADKVGLGAGRAMLEVVVRRCEAAGYRRMIAVIGDSGNLPSIRLHARLGFVHAGLLPAVGFKFGRWVDSVLMQRPLGPGDDQPPE